MAITTEDGIIAAAKQELIFTKTGGRTTVVGGWFSSFELAGSPGAGVLAGTSTTQGVVPTDATQGCIPINAFGGGNTGYITGFDVSAGAACRIRACDMLWKGGAYSYVAGTTTVTAPPSYASRVPGADYAGLEIWIEIVTAITGGTAWTVQVTYTNQAGTTGRTSIVTPNLAAADLTLGRMYQLALQAGDTGVQAIESVIVVNGGTPAGAGTFNVLVLRRLQSLRVQVGNGADLLGWQQTQMKRVYEDSAVIMMVATDGTSFNTPSMTLTIANG